MFGEHLWCFYLNLPLLMHICIFTARKRSLGQGNIFTPVCHSVHGGGVCSWRGACSWGVPAPGGCLVWGCLLLVGGGACPRGSASGGACSGVGCLLPRGLLPGGVCSRGVPAPREVPAPGGAWWRPPRQLLLWAVCIYWNAFL